MVELDVRDDHDLCFEREHRPVGLVGLHHEPFPCPPVGVAPGGAQRAADEVGGLEAAASSAWAIIDVVVVLPWAPATAIVRLSALSSRSSSARGWSRRPRSRAATRSGLSGGDRARAEDDLDVVAGGTLASVVAGADVDAQRAQGLGDRAGESRGPSR